MGFCAPVGGPRKGTLLGIMLMSSKQVGVQILVAE
jgi:hypothetical protein